VIDRQSFVLIHHDALHQPLSTADISDWGSTSKRCA
jgi:hypothetical protein